MRRGLRIVSSSDISNDIKIVCRKKVTIIIMILLTAILARSEEIIDNRPSLLLSVAFGVQTGSYDGVNAYSNGSSHGINGPYDTYGYQYQCVEYVNRFYVLALGHSNMRGGGNANNYFGTASSKGLIAYSNGGTVPPEPGDILCSNSGDYGHVAIVRSVSSSQITIIQQNWYNDNRDNAMEISMTVSGGRYTVSGFNSSYSVIGWLRKPGVSSYSAEFIDCSPNPGMESNNVQPYDIIPCTMRFRNSGTATWHCRGYDVVDPNYVEFTPLNSACSEVINSPISNSDASWINPQRIPLDESTVSSGGIGTVTFNARIPNTPGTQIYKFKINHFYCGNNWMTDDCNYFQFDIAPALSSPINRTTITSTRRPNFSWTYSSSQTNYRIVVYDNSSCSSSDIVPGFDHRGSGTSHSYTFSTDLPNGTYWWQVDGTYSGSDDTPFSEIYSFTIDVCSPPTSPSSADASPRTICSGSSSTLTTSGGSGTYKWYSGYCGGTLVGTGSSISVSPTSTTTYYVRCENDCGESSCESVTVNVTSEPLTPSYANASPISITSGSSSTLSTSGGSGTYNWYHGSCGGTFVGTGSSISVSPTSTTTYYVRCENDCGESSCESVTVNVSSPPTSPSSADASPRTICSGSSSTLTTSGGSGTYKWYSGSCGGTLVGTGSSISVSPTSTTTYYVRCENDCGESSCESVTVNVSSLPIAPYLATTTDGSICSGASTMITATGGSGTYNWYRGLCGVDYIGSGLSISVSPTSTTTYYVRCENSCGESSCESVTVNVSSLPIAPSNAFASPASITSGSSSTLTADGGFGDYRWYRGSCGGSSIGSGLSISVSPTSTTTYYVRCENECGDSDCRFVTVTVNDPTNRSISGNVTLGCGDNSSVEGIELEIWDITGGTPGTLFDTQTTDALGHYSFTGLTSGNDYRIIEGSDDYFFTTPLDPDRTFENTTTSLSYDLSIKYYADHDCNGIINIDDLRYVIGYILDPLSTYNDVYDINNDGALTIADIRLLFELIFG